MTGGGPKQKADEIARQADLTLRINRLRAPEDEFNEAANLVTKRRAKKRRKRRKT